MTKQITLLIAIGMLVMVGMPSAQAQSIIEDPLITQMMNNWVNYNRTHTRVRGWRIQIVVTTDRREMERVRQDFRRKYPKYELFFAHENPYYHLKTGAFLTQQDARPLLARLARSYRNAFLVTDEIDVHETLKYLE